jgi:hypothetical protein
LSWEFSWEYSKGLWSWGQEIFFRLYNNYEILFYKIFCSHVHIKPNFAIWL